jgi:hypothetical protein
MSVADPDPDPERYWPPGSGSGSTSQRFASGSGSFYRQANRKKSIICSSFFSMKPMKMKPFFSFFFFKQKQKIGVKQNSFLSILILRFNTKFADPGLGSGSISERHGFSGPGLDPASGPPEIVLDPRVRIRIR